MNSVISLISGSYCCVDPSIDTGDARCMADTVENLTATAGAARNNGLSVDSGAAVRGLRLVICSAGVCSRRFLVAVRARLRPSGDIVCVYGWNLAALKGTNSSPPGHNCSGGSIRVVAGSKV